MEIKFGVRWFISCGGLQESFVFPSWSSSASSRNVSGAKITIIHIIHKMVYSLQLYFSTLGGHFKLLFFPLPSLTFFNTAMISAGFCNNVSCHFTFVIVFYQTEMRSMQEKQTSTYSASTTTKKKIHAITQPHLCFDSCMSRSGSVKTVELTSAFCWQMQPKKTRQTRSSCKWKNIFLLFFFLNRQESLHTKAKKGFFLTQNYSGCVRIPSLPTT